MQRERQHRDHGCDRGEREDPTPSRPNTRGGDGRERCDLLLPGEPVLGRQAADHRGVLGRQVLGRQDAERVLVLRHDGFSWRGWQRDTKSHGSGTPMMLDHVEQLTRCRGTRGPGLAIFLEELADECFEQGIDLNGGNADAHRRRRRKHVRAGDVDAAALERHPSGQHLVEDQAEREQVDAVIELLAACLLGCHVVRRADDQAGRGQPLMRLVVSALLAHDGDPEVHDPCGLAAVGIAVDEDILRLEVAMDEPDIVRVLQTVTELPRDLEHARLFHRRLVCDQRRERLPGRVLHDEVVQTIVGLSDVHDPDDVWVAEPTCELRFALEPAHHFRVGHQPAMQDLDGKHAPHLDVACSVDRAHAAVA